MMKGLGVWVLSFEYSVGSSFFYWEAGLEDSKEDIECTTISIVSVILF